MKLTYYGHSCFEVQINGSRILFDPFIRPNPLAASIKVEELKPDYIFISHGHGDHIADAVEIATQSGATVVSNYEIIGWLEGKGIKGGIGLNLGGSCRFPWGKAQYVQALHSSTLPDGANGGNPGGFVITGGEGSFYYAGDTALTLDMQLIARKYKLDFAVLPIGDHFTMGIEDALTCAEFVNTPKVIGVHYNTFPPIKIDTGAAQAVFKQAGKELVLLSIGEERDI